MKRFGPRAAISLVLAVGALVGAAEPSAQAGDNGSELFGRAFRSVSVTKGGNPHELVEGTRIRVRLYHRRIHGHRRDILGWYAGCNSFGGKVDVTPEQLIVRQAAGTAMGCSRPLLRQDRWVGRFMTSKPGWALEGDELTLTEDDTVIELRRRSDS